jgi:hypothetical protein
VLPNLAGFDRSTKLAISWVHIPGRVIGYCHTPTRELGIKPDFLDLEL